MKYCMENGALRVTADSLGAELTSVVCGGKERLWQNQDGSWNRHAPVLFPVCGHCEMRVDGKSYPLPAHGFARKKEFTLEEKTKTLLRFTLCSDEETENVYPYSFRFSVIYELVGNKLKITYEVYDPAETPLYFSCGGHESYVLDGDIGEYSLVFPEPVPLVHQSHDDEGYLSGERTDFGTVKAFPLPKEMLLNGNTLIFSLPVHSVQLRHGEKTVAEIKFHGFENLLLWRPSEYNMVCIEPWCNLPDRAGDTREFSEKSGVLKVAPHGTRTLTREITYFEAR